MGDRMAFWVRPWELGSPSVCRDEINMGPGLGVQLCVPSTHLLSLPGQPCQAPQAVAPRRGIWWS